MFVDSIAFVCFCDAEHLLSAIAKFLVDLLGEGEGRGEMGGGWVEEGRGREGMERREMGMREKIASKRNIFGIWKSPLGATTHVIHFYKTLFTSKICFMDITSKLDDEQR